MFFYSLAVQQKWPFLEYPIVQKELVGVVGKNKMEATVKIN